MFLSRKFCLAGQAQLTQHYIAVDSFRLEGKLLAELWIRGSVLQLVGRPQLVGSPHYHLPPYLSLVTRHRTGALHRLHHPLYAACNTAVSIVVRDSCLELCVFFFYSVTDVISNVAKYNTSVKIYLSKSKI